MSQKITRRRFMQAGAAVLAVAALTACGGNTPSPSTSTARTLGDLTFDVTKGDDTATESDGIYERNYLAKLSVKNGSAAQAVAMKDVKFAMELEDGTELTAIASSKYEGRNELQPLVVAPQGSVEGWVGFGYQSTKREELQISYLTIVYAGKKVTYKVDGDIITAGGVTEA